MNINLSRYGIIIVICTIPLAFHSLIEEFIDRYWVIPIASKFEPSIFIDLSVLFVLGIFITQFFIFKWVKVRLGWNDLMYPIIIAVYYSLYRFQLFSFSHWTFKKTLLWYNFAYTDVLIIFPFLLLVYKFVPQPPPSTQSKDIKFSLLDDAPIKGISKDKLNRSSLAEFVAKYILNSSSQTSFAIGINAKWGDGKTSFQSMIADYIHNHDPNAIVFSFNPWKSTDEKKIVYDFFELLSDEVGVYDIGLSRKIEKYGNKLLEFSSTWWGTFIHNLFVRSRNQERQFDEINYALQSIKRKVVVFIDDLDRLSLIEIMEVIKLVRNSASFSNTFFVVGYDQEYIEEALKEHNHYGKDNFLEKIFQVQFDLSLVPRSVIIQHLHKLLIERLPEYKEEIDSVLGYKRSDNVTFEGEFLGVANSSDFIPNILKNLRDVKRFANFFSMNFSLVSSEVVFDEYFFISLVRFRYPILIRKIKDYEKSI